MYKLARFTFTITVIALSGVVIGRALEHSNKNARPSNTRLERAFKDLRYGMTEKDVRLTVEKYIFEPIDTKSRRVYAQEKVVDSRIYSKKYPKEGTPERNITWEGLGVDDEGGNYYTDKVSPTELSTDFDANGILRYATYRCKVELRFPDEDLQLRKDGVFPFNYAK